MTEPRRIPRPRLLVVCGPTGCGKSALAVELALRLGGEIIGCDALQIYRGFDVATAKPTADQRRAVRHHLVDCVDPRQPCTMADWVRAAESTIAAVDARGRVPVVVGGTGLYLRGLLRGVIAAPSRDAALRRRLRKIVARGGRDKLRAWLARADSDSAARIPAGDVQRLLRAVEVARSVGGNWSQRIRREGTWSRSDERYAALKIGLDDADRDRHDRALERRVAMFFERGLVDEVRSLLEAGVPETANAFAAIGYREVLHALRSGREPASVRPDVATRTRRYARRQRTWFRTEPDVVRLDVGLGTEGLAKAALSRWRP